MQLTGSSSTNPAADNLRTVVVALRCWWKLITPVAVVLALVAASAVYLLHRPVYTADAWLLIKDKPDVILREIDRGPQRFLQNQLEIVRSPRLLGALAGNPEIVATPELRYEVDIVQALAKRIGISPRGDSDIFVLSFSSRSPEKAELIVREVVNAYLAFNRKLDSENQTQILRLLHDQREARYQEMNQLRDKVRSLSIELTGVDPFKAAINPADAAKTDNSMLTLQADMVRYEVAQDILAAHIKAEEERQTQAEALSLEEQERIAKQIEAHPTYVASQTRISQLQRKQLDFERTSRNLPDNSAYRTIKVNLEAEQNAQELFAADMRKQLAKAAQGSREAARQEKLNNLRTELALGAARLKLLNEKFEERMGTAKQFTGDSLGLEFNRAKLEQVTKIHDEISSRILALTTEHRAPDRVMAFKEATLPLRPDEPIPWKKIIPAAGIAFLLPFGLVMLWEHLFRRITCRSQVETINSLSVVGEVTAVPSRKRGLSIAEQARQRDTLLFEESVDSLRTYLSLMDSLQDVSVLAVTSAISGEGKTTLAAQLAISLERATGLPTLLIDGDLRSPNLHERFDLRLGLGLAEVLSGKCSMNEAIQATGHGNLEIMPAGRLTMSPHRLLNNSSFAELLRDLRGKYRHIIIDTPPVLPASEALLIARSADAAVLCMRRDYTRLNQLQEAHERMLSAGIKTAGAVLNGIPMSLYTRKYGSYPYGTAIETPASAL